MLLILAIIYSTFIDTVILHLNYWIDTCVGAGEAFDDVDEEDDEG